MKQFLVTRTDLRTGTIIEETYLRGDVCQRNTKHGPAHIIRDADTKVVTLEEYKFKGEHHRIGGPAIIERHPESGRIVREAYLERGVRHRLRRPAVIEYDGAPDVNPPIALPRKLDADGKLGIVLCEEYFQGGWVHRDPRSGPAVTWWDRQSGVAIETAYFLHGFGHRNRGEGPSYVRRDRKSGEIVEEWFRRQTPEEMRAGLKRIQMPKRPTLHDVLQKLGTPKA